MTDNELKARIEALELQVKRALAYNEVQNVAHKFCWYHQSFRDDLIISELWAKKAPDIHSEQGPSGVYQGYESVIKWQYSDDDEIHKADIDDLIRAYEKEQGEEQEHE